jgi:hypothetical protein
MNAFNLIFCLLFIISAALQYNDPDPYVWMPIYMYGAVLAGLLSEINFIPKHTLSASLFTRFMLSAYFFGKNGVLDWINKHNAEDIAATMKAEKPWIEETREFFGLAILIVVLLIDFFYAKRMNSRKLVK